MSLVPEKEIKFTLIGELHPKMRKMRLSRKKGKKAKLAAHVKTRFSKSSNLERREE
jgi:hypothetical protein